MDFREALGKARFYEDLLSRVAEKRMKSGKFLTAKICTLKVFIHVFWSSSPHIFLTRVTGMLAAFTSRKFGAKLFHSSFLASISAQHMNVETLDDAS